MGSSPGGFDGASEPYTWRPSINSMSNSFTEEIDSMRLHFTLTHPECDVSRTSFPWLYDLISPVMRSPLESTTTSVFWASSAGARRTESATANDDARPQRPRPRGLIDANDFAAPSLSSGCSCRDSLPKRAADEPHLG